MTKWQVTRLDQCARIVGGSTPKTSVKDYWDGEIYWATPKDLSNLESPNLEGTPRRITKAGLDSCGAEVLPEGSVLFSSRAPIGHVAINCVPMATNQGFKSFVPDPEKLDAKFLYYWLRKNRTFFNSLGNGATFKEVSKAIVSRIEIPLPPIAQQKRIAAILDRAEELRSLRRQALGALDAIAQSIFLEMFGDPATNPKGWEVKSMDECAEKIQIGPFGTQLHEEDYIDDGIPSINPTHIQGGKIFPNKSFSVSIEKYKQLSQYHLETHDVILGRRGEMGRCAIVSEIENGWLCGTGSLFMRPKHSLLKSGYLFSFLSSKSIKQYLERASQGVTMANLNKTIVSQIPVLVPSIELQQEFVQRVEAIEQLKATHRESLAQLDALFASLQHRAFRGELSP